MIIDDIQEYKNSLEKARVYGKKLCREFQDALKSVIPDIKVHLGGVESGIDIVTFDSESHSSEENEDDTMIQSIVMEVFPEISADTDFGCYLSRSEADSAREILGKLRTGNIYMLLPYCDEDTARSILNNFSKAFIAELLNILKFIEGNYSKYGKPVLAPEYYENTNSIVYIDIVLENCGWHEWTDLERILLEREVLLKGKVAITCIKGLTGERE